MQKQLQKVHLDMNKNYPQWDAWKLSDHFFLNKVLGCANKRQNWVILSLGLTYHIYTNTKLKVQVSLWPTGLEESFQLMKQKSLRLFNMLLHSYFPQGIAKYALMSFWLTK